MKLTINDEMRDFEEGLTVAKLLEELELKGPLAVEVNRAVCPKKRHEETVLNDGDVLEIVTIVGGG